MFDAEVAATLLNRWASHTPTEECHAYLGLLREGNLHFTHKVGCMGMHGILDTGVCCTESLFSATVRGRCESARRTAKQVRPMGGAATASMTRATETMAARLRTSLHPRRLLSTNRCQIGGLPT